ncbi:hypothetical protein [Roseomonas indoligenes]|uniref:Uncharacterized protein n=1 Tax=Roseomonas indoligenes TaxID=2820811 RepID=A0A940S6M2_9PROT|nr:hypothetical protein [Pararoseomonas indoligenes]MBP0492133.1 hypothetical protein [Pararoseomonas indoligenes]
MTLSCEALRCLRVKHLPIGADFVRCVPKLEGNKPYTSEKDRLNACLRIAHELAEDGVFWTFSDEVGGDYVRVNRGTRAFRLICEMKS